MKRTLKRLEHYTSLRHVMENHPGIFTGRAALLSMKADFDRRVKRLSEIVAELSIPLFNIYKPKQFAEHELNAAMLRMTSLGQLDAHYRKDAVMLATMKSYKSQLRKVACSTLYYNAMQTATLLHGVSAFVTEKDFLTVELPAFRKQVTDFGDNLEKEAAQLQRRKLLRSELAALTASTNQLLREQFDTLAFIMKLKHPDYYREWVILRGDGSRQRRKSTYVKNEKASMSDSAISLTKRKSAEQSLKPIPFETAPETITNLPANHQSCDRPAYIPSELRKSLPEFIEKAINERPFVIMAGLRLIKPKVEVYPCSGILSGPRMYP